MSDKNMKLSQAIRIGSALHPKTIREYFGWEYVVPEQASPRSEWERKLVGTCAMGAAVVAVRGVPPISTGLDSDPSQVFPELDAQLINDSHTHTRATIKCEIVERNDMLGQTREEIADWLESIGL